MGNITNNISNRNRNRPPVVENENNRWLTNKTQLQQQQQPPGHLGFMGMVILGVVGKDKGQDKGLEEVEEEEGGMVCWRIIVYATML